MAEHFIIIGRTLLLYCIIIIIFRLMGKREIGELSILDLVVFIMIAEMAVIGIEDVKEPLINTIIPMVLLMIIQIVLAFISLKSQKFREIVDGKPTLIIENGKIDEKAMKQQRYNFNDLLIQLREKNIESVSDVEFAILEPSGKLSVFEKDKENKHKQNRNLDLPLILDGVIQESHLIRINKTNLWLRQELRKRGYHDMKKISYCSYHDGMFFIDSREK